jgi:hypothetical protein
MAHTSSTKTNRRLRKIDAPVTDERWKTRPSTEVTSDRGEDARRARERRHAENAPRSGRRPAATASDPLPRADRRK